MKTNLKKIFSRSCASPACHGLSAAALSHAGCLLLPGAAALAGATISGAAMSTFMFIASPVIAVAATISIGKYMGRKTSLKGIFGAAAMAITLTAGIQGYQTYRAAASTASEQPFDMKTFIKNQPMCGHIK